MKEAAYYEILDRGRVRCHLCPYDCVLNEGKIGACRVRQNKGGRLVSLNYNRVASAAMDPMEKKPLYHFFPGRKILSLGTTGCNFKCTFCQNHEISQAGPEAPTQRMTPEEAVRTARRHGADFIAYTYNEPLIWYEFVLETAQAAQEAGIRNVVVTNGYIYEEPLRKLMPYIDAMNLDIKSMSEQFYKTVCKGSLDPVLRTAEVAREFCHLEITDLIIPDQNDTPDEWERMAVWIAEHLGADTPVHLSAYTPRYRMTNDPTGVDLLERAHEQFARHLRHVFLGNVQSKTGADTQCSACGATMIRRRAYRVEVDAMNDDGTCAACGADNGIVNRN